MFKMSLTSAVNRLVTSPLGFRFSELAGCPAMRIIAGLRCSCSSRMARNLLAQRCRDSEKPTESFRDKPAELEKPHELRKPDLGGARRLIVTLI